MELLGNGSSHSILAYTVGSNWTVTMSSIMMIIATVSRGPKIIAIIGAMSIPDPTPTNPRIKPAATVTRDAIRLEIR